MKTFPPATRYQFVPYPIISHPHSKTNDITIKLGRKTTNIVPYRPNHEEKGGLPYIFGFLSYYFAAKKQENLVLPMLGKVFPN
jgi:hypothetical protein